MSTARVARRVAEPNVLGNVPHDRTTDVEEFRIDLERIYLSPYLSRLTAVTQVVSQVDSNQVVHNRMTHSMKVAAVAWSIAARLGREKGETARLIATLGGCDPVVAQAAGWAHDMGHPPFGHRGEQALDRIAKDRFGLFEGFEGNAQTFRILTELDVSDAATNGLNLTAAVRAAVLKYPWSRRIVHPRPGRDDVDGLLPVGSRPSADGMGPSKMSAYTIDLDELESVRSAYPALGQWQQTLEASIMDISDDITYSLHDLDDFYRAGVLQHSAVVREFRAWLDERAELATVEPASLRPELRGPGMSLEALRRRVHHNDPWIADDDAFTNAVERVRTDLVEGLLTIPFDGSIGAQRALSSFVSTWIAHLQDSVTVTDSPSVRSGHVTLQRRAWHEIAVLKFVHRRFVLERPELGLLGWGQAHVIETIVDAFDHWLQDRDESDRAPARLLDMIELARRDYRRLSSDRPELLEGATERSDLERLARGRGIIDYVASLTDGQAHAMARTITGHTELSWGSV